MPLKKSELYSSIWKSCDELRGGMDASQYKDYVLVLLFVKYVSDRYAGRKGAELDVPVGGRFADMVACKADKEIGDKLNKIIGKLADATDLKGVIDIADFNDADKLGKGKEMVDRLSNLIAIFDKPELDFRGNRAEGDDLLGDAYEYLMRHFATESGKSKGQFYTPAEVSRIIAKVIDVGSANDPRQTIHDPTCGSGSLLLKAHDEAKARTGHDLTLYGQEMDNATRALARMNMILHECPSAEIWQDNTLANPHWLDKNGKLRTFDFVVANPPFSSKSWSNGFEPGKDLFKRFELGIPPAKNGDYAFLLHVITALKPTGKGAVILPHGVLFRGNTEAEIRKQLVTRGYIKGLIGLPPNLFYGTGIPACIVVLDKEHASSRNGIFMIDASREFLKDGNKNRLRARDIHRIVDIFTRQLEVPGYARMVPDSEIEANGYNLNLPRYVDSSEPEDLQDIEAHLRGGIPERDVDALGEYWKVFPALRATLFAPERPGYLRLQVGLSDIKGAIFEHIEFVAFHRKVSALFAKWKKASLPRLMGIAVGDKPKELIEAISEGVLETFQKARLVDAYAGYQHLMDHWAEAMQDDVYLIVSEGWQGAAKLRLIPEEKDKKVKVKADLTVGALRYRAELVPVPIMLARHFQKEQKAIEVMEADAAAIRQQMEELDEEHGADDGLLAEARDGAGRLLRPNIVFRLDQIKDDPEAREEHKLLERYLDLMTTEAAASKKTRAAEKALSEAVVLKYGELSEDEVKTLIVEDKWLASLAGAVQGELDRVSQALTGRIRELAERYAKPLPEIVEGIEALSARVSCHVEKMAAR